jgi:putative methylase
MKSKKQLAVFLSRLKKIENINRGLEQYQTESELAAEIIWDAFMQRDIENNLIYDLGCGNGIFGIGALLMGAKECTFIDSDKKAINILEENLSDNMLEAKIINKDIEQISLDEYNSSNNELSKDSLKIVLMNPPFGTKKEHADKAFLELAIKFADVIYSIHLRDSESFLRAFSESNNFEVIFIKEFEFGIKKSHPKHKKKKLNIPIICIKLKKKY